MARPVNGRDFWDIANPEDGSVTWLGLSRMDAGSAIDRKIWTLIPSSRMFVTNWFVTDDHIRRDCQIWDHLSRGWGRVSTCDNLGVHDDVLSRVLGVTSFRLARYGAAHVPDEHSGNRHTFACNGCPPLNEITFVPCI